MNKFLQTVNLEMRNIKEALNQRRNEKETFLRMIFFKTKLVFTFLLVANLGFSQAYNMDGSAINDCGGFFYDSGGSNGDYSASESFTTTICSDATTGTHIQLIFSAVDLGTGDQICFFDGTDTSNPIACNTDFLPGNPFIIQASAANVGGCLTITFNSDGASEAAGWQADINCIPACQTILADLVNSDPVVAPVDTGYIDICQGERVFFNAEGIYPQNNQVYNHSDLTSEFEWDFGDGAIGLGPNVSHVYEESGGYIVQLTITDQFGCTNTNFLSQRVRVSTSPNFAILGDIPQQICVGDTIDLNAAVSIMDSSVVVGVTPTQGSFPNSGVNSDTIPLPDGVGVAYENSLSFGNFSPGQVLTSVDDLISICVIMEHSWMRDLEIALICPDGTEVILHDHPANTGGEVFLGEPNTTDEGLPVPISGVGYEYCWTVDATNGTWLEYANNILPPFNATLPAGDYNSFDPLDNFLGCPMNGDWTIRIEDLWGSDNGFVFEWSIEFDPSLYPDLEVFTPAIASYNWGNNPSIFFQTNDSISAKPQNAGTASYSFGIEDGFGCSYDTTVLITVLPPTHPDCFSCPQPEQLLQDTTLCEGDLVQVTAENTTSLAGQPITFEAFPTYVFGFSNHPPPNPYASSLEITSINPLTITNAQEQICGVCVDLETDFDGDIRLFLRSPSGQTLELSTNNGGSGNDYTNTCFTATASTQIFDGSAPFTGDFLPEGNWNDLNGSTINGTWQLLVSDGFGVNGLGVLNSWSLCFNNVNEVDYQWGPVAGLSCYDCPDPLVNTTTSSTYTVDISDDFGCNYSDTVQVNILPVIAAPTNVTCDSLFSGVMSFVWESVPGFTDYLVNINGTGWVPSNEVNKHLISGLTNGDIVSFQVQVDSGNGLCNVGIGNASCTYFVCEIELELPPNGVVPPSCYNETDGTIFVQAMGNGTGPFTYQIDNEPTQTNGIFTTGAGDHQIILSDVDGCADTLIVNVPVGDSIGVSIVTTDVSCNGTSTGSATATGTNSTDPFMYTWNTSPILTFNQTISDVPAGDYIVTVTDGGCTVIDTVTIGEPPLLEVNATPVAVSCANGDNGSASTLVMGGTAPYSYLWSDGQMTSTAINLTAGTYTVVVTDSLGCFMDATAVVMEPSGMNFSAVSINVDCFGQNNGSIDLEVNGGSMPYNYEWDDAATSQDRNNLLANTYCVTVTDGNLCTKDTCFIITQPDSISLMMSSTSTTCLGNNTDGTATVLATGGVGSTYTFLWNDGQMNSTAVGLSPGNYCVVVSDGNGCQANACVDVTSPPVITIDSIVATDVLCNGEDTGLATVFASAGSGSFTYLWSDALAQFSNPANSLEQGTYTVTVTDASFCTATATVFVDEPTVLTTTITPTDANCFGGNDGIATANPLGGVEPYNFSWTTLPGQSTQTVENLTAGTYTVTVTDDNGCETIQTTVIQEPATAITALVTQTKEGCFGANDSEAQVVAMGGTGINYTYEWSNVPASNTANATNLDGGNTYFVTVTDANGCEAIENLMITDLDEVQVLSVIEVDPTCNGDVDGILAVNIVAGGVGNGDLDNYSYTWSNGLSTSQPILNLAAGTYTVTITDAQGCQGTKESILIDPLEVTATANIQDASCFGLADGQIQLEATSGNVPIASYLWDNNANNQITSTATDLGVGGYLVTITDDNSCSTIANFAVGEPDQITVEFEVTDNPCFSDSEASINTTVNGGTPEYTYSWTSTDTLSTFSSTEQNIRDLFANRYIVTITDNNGCVKIDSVNVNSPPALWGIVEADSITCFGDQDGLIHIEGQGGEGPYSYSLDGEDFTSTNSFLGLEEGGYTTYIRDRNGCETTVNTNVFGPAELEVELGDDITILLGEDVNLNAIVNLPGNYIYTWTPEDSLICNDCPSTIARGLIFQTSYQVIVENEFGCKAEDFINVFVKKFRRVYVPTGFSPNGDTNNDILRVHGEKGTKITTFRVYDRWGEMVYENQDGFDINVPDIGWDGTFDGKEMNPGVFVWYLELEYADGAIGTLKGHTTLVK